MLTVLEAVQELIQEECKHLTVKETTEITIEYNTNFVPLEIPATEGQWLLVGWKQLNYAIWELVYTYQGVKAQQIIVKTPAGWLAVNGTRTQNRARICEIVKILNTTVVSEQVDWPFRIEECE